MVYDNILFCITNKSRLKGFNIKKRIKSHNGRKFPDIANNDDSPYKRGGDYTSHQLASDSKSIYLVGSSKKQDHNGKLVLYKLHVSDRSIKLLDEFYLDFNKSEIVGTFFACGKLHILDWKEKKPNLYVKYIYDTSLRKGKNLPPDELAIDIGTDPKDFFSSFIYNWKERKLYVYSSYYARGQLDSFDVSIVTN